MELVVRGSQGPALLLAAIRREVETLDPQLPIVNLQSLTAHLGTSLMPAALRAERWDSSGSSGLLLAGSGCTA